MRNARGRLAIVVGAVLAVAPAAIAACADSSSAEIDSTQPDAGAEGGRDAGRARDAGSAAEAGSRTTCEITRAYFEACGFDGQLNCGADFDAWCAANDATINSEAYRRAEEACLTEENCNSTKRRDCEYRHYADETATPSQQALVEAYCATCEPASTSACEARATRYFGGDVADIFIAAWELADPIVDEIKEKCTGVPGDADAGACAKAFSLCAGDVYLSHVPDCPE